MERVPAAVHVGAVGCGIIAQVVHLPTLPRLSGVRIAALADPDARRLHHARGLALLNEPVPQAMRGSVRRELLRQTPGATGSTETV